MADQIVLRLEASDDPAVGVFSAGAISDLPPPEMDRLHARLPVGSFIPGWTTDHYFGFASWGQYERWADSPATRRRLARWQRACGPDRKRYLILAVYLAEDFIDDGHQVAFRLDQAIRIAAYSPAGIRGRYCRRRGL